MKARLTGGPSPDAIGVSEPWKLPTGEPELSVQERSRAYAPVGWNFFVVTVNEPATTSTLFSTVAVPL